MISKDYALNCLRHAIGKPDAEFRDGQWEAIQAVLDRKRVLVVERTGWGKSIVYFLASRFLKEEGRGMTLLISPLLSLMRNQIVASKNIGIKCITINSLSNDNTNSLEEAATGKIDLLLISPERLSNEDFQNALYRIAPRVGLLVIDEVHCISDWGHDFRPDYRKIVRLISNLPENIPVLGTTATANERVIEDIREQFNGSIDICIRGNLVRNSLFLQTINIPSQEERLAWIADTLINRIKGSGIIYALTIRDCEYVAQWLRQNGIQAYAYSSIVVPPEDMDQTLLKELSSRPDWDEDKPNAATRSFLEDLLLSNRIRALVATSALGMGFDKPDLSFVIHYQRPQSIIHYYQQVGRAGRGVDFAYGILLHGKEDDDISNFFINQAFPKEEEVRTIINAIASSNYGISTTGLQKMFNIRKSKIDAVLKFLMYEPLSPIVKNEGKYYATPMYSQYRLPHERISHITGIREVEVAKMNEYMSYEGCLMNFLCRELDSPSPPCNCSNCIRCKPEMALPTTINSELSYNATRFLNRLHIQIAPRKLWYCEDGRNHYIPKNRMMEPGWSLVAYGSGELGKLIKTGKYDSDPPYFSDRLVDECITMLNEKGTKVKLEWVTCIPSRKSPSLVEDFAQRLACKLGLPYIHCIEKIKDTPGQKEMANSIQQQQNIKDAFRISTKIPECNCLLVDDIVDSRWTFTIVSFLLREAGALTVTPMALADSSNREE